MVPVFCYSPRCRLYRCSDILIDQFGGQPDEKAKWDKQNCILQMVLLHFWRSLFAQKRNYYSVINHFYFLKLILAKENVFFISHINLILCDTCALNKKHLHFNKKINFLRPVSTLKNQTKSIEPIPSCTQVKEDIVCLGLFARSSQLCVLTWIIHVCLIIRVTWREQECYNNLQVHLQQKRQVLFYASRWKNVLFCMFVFLF